jgi:precorrin-2/cobalt-factor-2 C20-methyltransferase
LLDTLRQADKLKNSALVCNCGLPDEQVCPDLSRGQPQVQPGYFTTVLVKE